jgi:hypothetical protein
MGVGKGRDGWGRVWLIGGKDYVNIKYIYTTPYFFI